MRPTLLVAVLALAAACPACGDGGVGPDPDPKYPEKIDRPVQARMDEDSVPVLILGTEQPLLGTTGLADFIAANQGRGRLELRTEHVARLKDIAAAAQAPILAALDGAAEVAPLWIVNAVAARITPEKIIQMANRDDVAFIYESDLNPGRAIGPDAVATVLMPAPEPFARDDKAAPWYLDSLRVTEAWADNATGQGVVIAMLDSGIEYRHADIRNRMWTNPGEVPNNGVDDDGNGYVDDYYGYDFPARSPEVLPSSSPHGAFVAGILVGDGTGGTVTGVAPDARVMALKGSALVFTLQALQYALDEGADIVNMSFSLPRLGNLRGVWRLAADNATAAGLVMVSGAGNFRETQPVPVQLRTPEDIPSVIAAGGVDADGVRTSFSSGGPVSWADVKFYEDHSLADGGLLKPDLAAFPGPGYTTLNPSSAGGYIGPDDAPAGNSFSGPQVAGIAALILSVAPDLTAWEVREILESTARDLGTPGKDNDTGWGLVDAASAVDAAMR